MFKSQNLLFISEKEIDKIILKNSTYIQSAQIEKVFPHSLKVYVTERTPVVVIERENERYFLDIEGRLLKLLSAYETRPYPVLKCEFQGEVGQQIQSESIRSLLSVISNLAKSEDLLTEVDCQNEMTYLLVFENTEVLVSSEQNPKEVVASLLFLLKQFRIEGKYPKLVDLRFEKPVLMRDGIYVASPASIPSSAN